MIFLIKSRKTDLAFRGEITAFLSLIFILMLSVVGALIESASIQISRSRKRADVTLALESAFAEYDRDLLEKYDVFARCENSEGWLVSRLEYYGASNMTHRIVKSEFLTDNQGLAFYEQAVRYMKDWVGMEGTLSGSGYDFENDSSWKEKEDEFGIELVELVQEEETELAETDNPLNWLDNMKGMSLLTFVTTEESELSTRSVKLEELPSGRTLEKGNYEKITDSGATDKLFFLAYLTEHFSDFTENSAEQALLYELEYLLGGQASDRDNLEAVCQKLLNIRMVSNYVYLLTDTARQAEAEALALTICSAFANPHISGVVKDLILLAWAYGESMVDVRALLKQKKVPMVKTAESWQLQLSNLMKLGTSEEITGEKDLANGLSYQDYLKGLLLLENTEDLCMRSLDMIESNLHIKTDKCMTKVQLESVVSLRRGIQDTFKAEFAYQ